MFDFIFWPMITPGPNAARYKMTHYFVSVWFQALNKPGCKTDWTHRLERRKRMAALSDSNPNTQKEGGGKLCPIVTPAERNERKQKRRGGGAWGAYIYPDTAKKNARHLSKWLKLGINCKKGRDFLSHVSRSRDGIEEFSSAMTQTFRGRRKGAI